MLAAVVGAYKDGGREWSPAGEPVKVKMHDFIAPDLGKANPCGVYDVAADTGWVSVGTDHDTARFAVATVARWWTSVGGRLLPRGHRAADQPPSTRQLTTRPTPTTLDNRGH